MGEWLKDDNRGNETLPSEMKIDLFDALEWFPRKG